jgi:hypothetical protein
MIRLTTLILTCLFTLSVKGQLNDFEMQRVVLKNEIVDSLYIFGKWTENGQTETHLKYLGKVVTPDGRIFKIMNSCYFWGLSHRATSRILIFNDQNEYLGNYVLGMTSDLPNKLENGKLIFDNNDNKSCDKTLISIVNFLNGIPKEIFIKCKDNSGDRYPFSNE